MKKPIKFRICFFYSENGRLRTKVRTVEAADWTQIIEKLKREFGQVRITSAEKIK